MPAALRRRNVTRKTGLALLAAAGVWLACGTPYAPALVDSGAASNLEHALAQIGPLKQQVDAGRIIPGFGDKAQEIVSKACGTAGSAAPELEMAIDGALEGLFMRQAAMLSKQVAEKFADSQAPIDAARMADQLFLEKAQELVRPGSGWSLEFERGQLRESITAGFRRDAAVAEERAQAATTQQSTIAVISKLQEQMENLAMKVQSSRGGGSPWVLSSSYRIPNTPLQLVGRYEQGRANVELNLTPDKNPLNSDASFVEGIGPANIGVSFNLGI